MSSFLLLILSYMYTVWHYLSPSLNLMQKNPKLFIQVSCVIAAKHFLVPMVSSGDVISLIKRKNYFLHYMRSWKCLATSWGCILWRPWLFSSWYAFVQVSYDKMKIFLKYFNFQLGSIFYVTPVGFWRFPGE